MTTTTFPGQTTTRTASALLRDLMNDALAVVADEDTDSFDSRTPAGRAVLSLAALARQAAGALGADAGTTVASGPGVVVVREFAAAAHLLDSAGSRSEPADVDGFLATAKGLHARLHDAVA